LLDNLDIRRAATWSEQWEWVGLDLA